MRNYLTTIVSILFSMSVFATTPAPIGYWKTIDDVTGKAKAIVEITYNQHKQLQGRILKVFYEPNKEKQTRCTLCSGDKKNQPIIGMVIMTGLQQANTAIPRWEGGTILDPKTGKVYRCRLDYDIEKNRVTVRGYIGLPLLGRTQLWERVSTPDSDQ